MKKFILIACFSLVIAASTMAKDFWQRTNGPYGGIVRVLASSGERMFAGADGGIYRSTDRGMTWCQPSFVPWPWTFDVVLAMSVHPSGILVVASLGWPVRSTNDGETWDTTRCHSIVYDLAYDRNGRLFAASENGILVSTDDGATWSTFALEGTAVSKIALLPQGGYVATIWSQVYRSDDGVNWSMSNFPGQYVTSFATTHQGHLLAGTWQHGLFVSTDAGASWNPTPVPTNRVNCVMVDSLGRVFVGGFGLFVAQDYSGPWISLGLETDEVLSVNFDDTETLYASTWNHGIFRTSNFGGSWVESNSGLASTSILSLHALSNNDVLAGTINGFIYRSTDLGLTWRLLFSEDGSNISCLTSNVNGDIFAAVGAYVYLSTNAGGTWTRLNLLCVENGYYYGPLSIAFAGPNNIFVGSSGGYIYRSVDRGRNWQRVRSPNQNSQEEMNALMTTANGALFAGTQTYNESSKGTVLRSTDGGTTWSAVLQGVPGILDLISDSRGNQYAGTNGDGIYRSTNGGTIWSRLPSQFTYAGDLALLNGERLFAGLWGRVYTSTDEGMSWQELQSGFPPQFMFSMAVTPSGYVFAGTQNYGLFRSVNAMEPVIHQPSSYKLLQNYPNPFNLGTRISFSLPTPDRITVQVFNIMGQEVAKLVDEERPAGDYTLDWNAKGLASGLYFCRLIANGSVQTMKMILLR